ncbi:hypothetical protein [Spiroplasma endosymbiont of Stenodema calcarata]|uniref:hypothetical protein n=1 Tax=Spiroplasma endosymbiont of Stenodema calcarata TaxID=3139328 RepID=UPI003CCA90A6
MEFRWGKEVEEITNIPVCLAKHRRLCKKPTIEYINKLLWASFPKKNNLKEFRLVEVELAIILLNNWQQRNWEYIYSN